jgi:tetratricopeptide (TPR) repeat protein
MLLFFFVSGLVIFGQKENSLIRKGNNLYDEGKFKEAEKYYRKALEINNANQTAQFNLGTAVYKNNDFEEAARIYSGMTGAKDDPAMQAKILHNMGNSYLKARDYEKSILAYKNALRNDPGNRDTKYNLEYARMMLKQQQNQQNKQEQNKKDDQDKKDQQQNQDKKDQQKNQEKNQNQTPDQRKISKEDASRMLEALKNDEKKTQQKGKKQQAKVQVVGVEKDW